MNINVLQYELGGPGGGGGVLHGSGGAVEAVRGAFVAFGALVYGASVVVLGALLVLVDEADLDLPIVDRVVED